MVIQINYNGKRAFIQQKKKRQPPIITANKNLAVIFSDLNVCKNIRDDVLEYFPNAVICG